MRGSWRRLVRLLPIARPRAARVSVQEKFACLRSIGSDNDAFLNSLARFQESLESGPTVRGGGVEEAYEALSSPVGSMARALVVMGEGRYDQLLRAYERLDRELSQEVLRARPMESGPLVLWPGEQFANLPEVVGPKTARLAELAVGGECDVPPFFVITAYGFRLFMEATGLQDLVQGALAVTDLNDDEALDAFAQLIMGAISDAPLPARLEQDIAIALRRLHGRTRDDLRVAVRSSAVVEDAESSFAGQFESVLNVPAGDVSGAYKLVVASKYRTEALRYASARGFLEADVAMPVLVMAMVEPEASGVAYSRNPDHPDSALVTAVSGLAQVVVEGRVIPDSFLVAEGEPPVVLLEAAGVRAVTLRCASAGGLEEAEGLGAATRGLALNHHEAGRVAKLSWALERRFGAPQDVEWALDPSGVLWVVQTRPLTFSSGPAVRARPGRVLAGYRVLLRGAARASGGVVTGPVVKKENPANLGDIPSGCILVCPVTSPRLAGVMSKVAGLVTEVGSTTGHMSTVAREFGVPCLVGAERAMAVLANGQLVTLDAEAGVIYDGEVPELLAEATPAAGVTHRDAVRESLQRLVDRVAPLSLTNPTDPHFNVEHCRTLHDIARFIHQQSIAEIFAIEGLAPGERRASRRLVWPRLMEVLLLDLGGGLAEASGRRVPVEDVRSIPLLALLEGMMDSRLRWAGPVGFDLKGFMSVVVRSAADDQRYGEPSFALCSRDFLHFASRLAYHFAILDAICGESVNENYVRFRFHGGAAVAQRREWRGHFLATVLRANRFEVTQVGDRVDAILAKRVAAELEEALVMVGRLMVASRHLDMVIESPAVAVALAQAFLSGDYGFEMVRTGSGR